MKKNRFFTVTVIASVMMSVTSCHDNEIDVLSDQRTEVQFSTNIRTMDVNLRAAGNTWHPLDPIGIYMYEENNIEVVDEMENISYVTEVGGSTGNFKPVSTVIYFPDNGDKVRFMSYYPYRSTVSDNGDVFKVNIGDQSEQPKIDLLYSFDIGTKYDKKSPGKKVSLIFTHQLTKIHVNVKAGEGLSDTDLQNVTTSFLGLNTKADFNLVTGVLSDLSDPQEILLKPMTAAVDYKASFEAIVLPTADFSGVQMTLDLKNGDIGEGIASDKFVWSLNRELAPSTKYTFNVIVNRSGIVVEATINDWTNADADDIIAE